MAHIFRLKVEKDKSSLALIESGIVKAVHEWPESRDMGRKLFEAIETILQERGLKPQDIAEFRIVSDLPESSTSRRIAETVAKVYTFGVSLSTE